MPTRMIHDGYLTSPSVRICSPAAQDALPRFWLLADDFGCFDASPRVLVGKGWPYREDVTEDRVRAWLVEYAMAGMLVLWEEKGRWWGFLTGWWEHQRYREEYSARNRKGSKRKTPRPPTEQGDVAGFAAGRAPVSRVPGDFPGGKWSDETISDSAVLSTSREPAARPSLALPGGKPSLAVDFPDTQSQSQSQSQPQSERAAGPPAVKARPTGIGTIGDFWERTQNTPFVGKPRVIADTLLEAGYPAEHVVGALAEAQRAEGVGEADSLFGAWQLLAEKTRLGAPFRWATKAAAREPPPPKNHARKPVVPPVPQAPKESGS